METWCGAKGENHVTTRIVKFFDESRGSGFIVRDDDAPNVYVNPSMCIGGACRTGIEFDVEQTEVGPRARNVGKNWNFLSWSDQGQKLVFVEPTKLY